MKMLLVKMSLNYLANKLANMTGTNLAQKICCFPNILLMINMLIRSYGQLTHDDFDRLVKTVDGENRPIVYEYL